jgi:hypothetical protein
VGQEKLGPSYLFISFVLGPLNSLFMDDDDLLSLSSIKRLFRGHNTYLPQGLYGAWLLFFVSARKNKRNHHLKRVQGRENGNCTA